MKKIEHIDPMIGTVGSVRSASIHGGGKTHPGACTPGGMVQLSPDTVTGGDNGTGYNYCQNTIEGFSVNHLSGIGWYGDLGNLQIMPVVGDTDLRSGTNREIYFEKGSIGWKSEFSHEKEKASAGYYAVFLERYGIWAEATSAPRAGILRFSYPDGSDARVILNFSRRIGGHADFQKVSIVSERRLEGEIRCTPKGGGFGRGKGGIDYVLYFVCEFSALPKRMLFFEKETFVECGEREGVFQEYSGEDVGLLVEFGPELSEPLEIKIGISYTDLEGARKNFQAEAKENEFDTMKNAAEAAWEKVLDVVEVEGSNQTDLKLFYTCLYHTLLDPRISADTDGRFRLNGDVVVDTDYTHRTVFSGWDVYRSEFPLLTLIRPDMIHDEVNSLLHIADAKNTSLPRWELLGIDSGCMVGDPGLLVLVDAYIKGIRSFDVEKAYDIAMASCKATEIRGGREFKSLHPRSVCYQQGAFVPESLSDTLEFLMADYVMYRLAQSLGKEEDAAYFLSRVKRYKENYNPKLGFMAPRDEEGAFLVVTDEYDSLGCVESNILQQSFFAPYDVQGLSELFGRDRFIEIMERLFGQADFSALWNDNYNHSNEPCHNITHYFNILGLAHRTQYWTRRVQKEAYREGAFGFCGNEDVGQLSAWYVLSALGFAQVCPGHATYFVNTPLFKKATVKLDPKYHTCTTSDVFVVECDNDPLEFPYIKSMSLNGTELSRSYLTYEEIIGGGKLEFSLSKEPCPEFGKEMPESFLA